MVFRSSKTFHLQIPFISYKLTDANEPIATPHRAERAQYFYRHAYRASAHEKNCTILFQTEIH